MANLIGEPLSLEGTVLFWLGALPWALMVTTLGFAIWAFSWWAIVALPVTALVCIVNHSSSIAPEFPLPSFIWTAIALIVVPFLEARLGLKLYAIAFGLTIYAPRLYYTSSQVFLRRLVLRNCEAFNLLIEKVVFMKLPEEVGAPIEPLFRHSFSEGMFGADFPYVPGRLKGLAEMYRNEGRYAEAEPLYRRVLEIQEKAFGPDHTDVATSLENLAILYRATERVAEAKQLETRASEIRAIKR